MPAKRNKPGPKPKIGDKERDDVFACLSVGGSLADAAGYIGVNASTLRRAKAADPEFARGVRQAVLKGKIHHLNKIGKAKQWQASAWMLERRWGKQFGRKDKLDVTTKGRAFTLNIGTNATAQAD